MPGGAAQATMHDFVRRPLARTQAQACDGQAAGHSLRCDDAADLCIDGMRLRRDRVGQWVFPRSKKYPCVVVSPAPRNVQTERATHWMIVCLLSQHEAVPARHRQAGRSAEHARVTSNRNRQDTYRSSRHVQLPSMVRARQNRVPGAHTAARVAADPCVLPGDLDIYRAHG